MELNKVEKPNKLIVDINNLNIGYNNQTILSNINLQIQQGQCWAIIGPSGSGKTTLFKTINTLIKPLKGSLKLIDIPVDSKKNISRLKGKIGYIPQNLGLISNLNVKENILTGSLGRLSIFQSIFGIIPEDEIINTSKIMKQLKIDHLANKDIRLISGGEKRRVAIARSLLHNPPLLVADELLSELDPLTVKLVMNQVKSLQNKSNTTIILIEHNIEVAAKYADVIVVINEGKIISQFSSTDTTKMNEIKELITI
ncbi:MAG: ATP-binding cassette domain-containing protein [Asgard group archaeon]|nr:ATP-binding cassette domain-containing protein [Asgard group archaeon]